MRLESIANPPPPSRYEARETRMWWSGKSAYGTCALCMEWLRTKCFKSRAFEFDRPSSCAFPLGRKGVMHTGTHWILLCVMSSDEAQRRLWHLQQALMPSSQVWNWGICFGNRTSWECRYKQNIIQSSCRIFFISLNYKLRATKDFCDVLMLVFRVYCSALIMEVYEAVHCTRIGPHFFASITQT